MNSSTDKKILRNRARCNSCGETVESKHVHDFQGCKCGNLYVDGGKTYLRRVWTPLLPMFKGQTPLEPYEELSEFEGG